MTSFFLVSWSGQVWGLWANKNKYKNRWTGKLPSYTTSGYPPTRACLVCWNQWDWLLRWFNISYKAISYGRIFLNPKKISEYAVFSIYIHTCFHVFQTQSLTEPGLLFSDYLRPFWWEVYIIRISVRSSFLQGGNRSSSIFFYGVVTFRLPDKTTRSGRDFQVYIDVFIPKNCLLFA